MKNTYDYNRTAKTVLFFCGFRHSFEWRSDAIVIAREECMKGLKNMSQYYLAVDIGASSGRHILGTVIDGKIQMEEIYRFENGLKKVDGKLCWDVEKLFAEILKGLKKCKELNKIPVSMGIDTWAVDFVLLDKDDKILGNSVGYRDSRTEGMDELVYEKISQNDLYERTGIQKQIFNTIYQLMAVKNQNPEHLEQAECMLMIPDYFHYLLTGKKVTEYTNATTTQLVSPVTKDWDYELIEMLGYPKKMFLPIVKAGEKLGHFTEEIEKEVGFSCEVVLPATHDTGSAVLAVPSNDEKTLYISSGTWSLMGVENKEAICTKESRELNFTNEGGYEYRFRFLKNIMGLWMVQSLKKELGDKYSFAELCEMATLAEITSTVDCNSSVFLAPESMIKAVQDMCESTKQQIPTTPAELARVIYQSLAKCYGDTIGEIESQTHCKYEQLHIVGGGANAAYLNQLTANATGIKVLAGPTEATAIGNLTVQMLQKKEWDSLTAARTAIFESFKVDTYEPRIWNDVCCHK